MSTGRSGMSNGARHALGAVAGLAAAPVIMALMVFGVERLIRAYRLLLGEGGTERWIGAGCLFLAALVIGLLVGSRVSPLASLLCGLTLCAVNLPWLLMNRTLLRHVWDLLPREYRGSVDTLGSLGILGLVGGVLIVGSLAPSRWRSATMPHPAGAPRPPAWTPPGAPAMPPAGPGGPAALPAGPGAPAAPAGPGGAPDGPSPAGVPVGPGAPPLHESGPPYIPPQPAGDAPPPQRYGPPDRPGQDSEEEDQPGEWTHIYGGEGARRDEGRQS